MGRALNMVADSANAIVQAAGDDVVAGQAPGGGQVRVLALNSVTTAAALRMVTPRSRPIRGRVSAESWPTAA